MTLLFFAALSAYALAAAVGSLRPAIRFSTALAVLGALTFGGLAAAALGGGRLDVLVPLGPPSFALRFALPPLSALFVLLVSGVGALASVYGSAYVAHLPAPKRRTVLLFTPLFLAAMSLVAAAADVTAFLLAWEVMSLASYALVMTEAERPEVVRAGYVYLLMTHVGAVCLLAGFLLLASATGSMDFAVWARTAPALPLGIRSLVMVLALLGFGSKAALVPLHVWLPRAHPVAPSHVSGLMSGVMLKMAVYGLVLVGFMFLGTGPLWWGLLVLGLGALSSVLGVLYALMEHDLKRLLAYHSIENVGIITMGIGVALIARTSGLHALAILAMTAALYHTVNHALFKTALFLDAGAIQTAGAGRNLDAMGGLIRRMPWTALSMLLAAASIAGLPPFNGFVSEWLTYQSLTRLAAEGAPLMALAAFAGVLALALTGGLAAACFAKVSGVGLLGRPRTAQAGLAREVGGAMYIPALVLAGLCVGLGLLPGALARPLAAVARLALHATGGSSGAPVARVVALSLPWSGARLTPALVAAAAAAVGIAAAIALTAGRRSRRAPAIRPAWACGGELGVESQYSATAYAKPLRQVFGLVYRPVREVRIDYAVHPFFRTRVEYKGAITHVVDRYVYAPASAAMLALARSGRRLQSGSLRLYLGYLLATLILLLTFVR